MDIVTYTSPHPVAVSLNIVYKKRIAQPDIKLLTIKSKYIVKYYAHIVC